MAGTSHHCLPPLLLLIAFSIICSYAYSDVAHSPSAGPSFHHNNKPSPGYNPTLPPQSHGKPSPFPVHKPPHDHKKPPTSPPHPFDFPHPSPMISKPHPPPVVEKHQPHKPVHDGRHPSPPGKPHSPIKPPPRVLNNINVHHPQVVPLNPPVHLIPAAAPHDQHPNPTPYNSRLPPPNHHSPHSPPNPKTPTSPFNHNTRPKEPIHHVRPFPPSYSPHSYKSPPAHDRHQGIYTAPPPIHY